MILKTRYILRGLSSRPYVWRSYGDGGVVKFKLWLYYAPTDPADLQKRDASRDFKIIPIIIEGIDGNNFHEKY